MENYKLLSILDKGSFGSVYIAEQRDTGKMVAIKQISKTKLTTPGKLSRAERDAFIPQYLGCEHKNIICVIDSFQDKEFFYIVSEYIENVKTLDKYKTDLSTRAGMLQLLDLFQQLADGLAYMHSKSIIHNDIKLANILVKGNIPFYIDFDLACFLPSSGLNKFLCKPKVFGTPNYLAPEIISEEFGDPRQRDIFALGVVYFAVVTGELPFDRELIEDVFDAILGEDVPDFTSGIPELDELILEMLDKKPVRPTAMKIKSRLNEMIRLA